MYSIPLAWKAYNVNLAAVDTWIKTNIGEAYLGNSADTKLTLWFSYEISEIQKQLVQDYWDDMTINSVEAESYVSQANISDVIADLKATMINKDWNDLTIAERKLIMGQQPTLEELGLA